MERNNQKQVTINDLCQLKSPSAVSYNPSGTAYAFVLTEIVKEKEYQSSIWVKKEGMEAYRLTSSGTDKSPVWENDETILFISQRTSDDKAKDLEEKTSFYRISIHGGEAVKAFDIPKNTVFFKKAAEGVYCIASEENRHALPICDDNEDERKEELDYHVIDEVPLWGNGRGYIAGTRTVLYCYKEADGSLTRLTPEYFDTAEIAVKDDMVLCVGKYWKDVITEDDSIRLYQLKDGSETILVDQGIYTISHAAFYQDTILFTGTDRIPYGNGQYHDLYLLGEDGTPRLLVKNEHHIGLDIMCDCCYGSGKTFLVNENGAEWIAQYGYQDRLLCMDKQENVSEMLAFAGAVSCFDSAEGKKVFVGIEKAGCPEIYEYIDGHVTKVTTFNDTFLQEHFVSVPKYIPFVNRAGISIDGWVLEPYEYDETKTYPGVLEIHGGPRCTYGEGFFHEMQVWASKGFFVFFCNPRGSEGYGEAFADLRGKYGTIDYEDLMDFTDHVLSLYHQMNPKAIGAAGGSYGGFMCNWIEGHTDRFAAIASQRSVSNWVSDFGCSEIGVTFDPNEMLTTPWKDMQAMWDCSPLKYACNAKTPILFIHSLCDYNCTLDQGVQMFTAVKYFGVPSRMCLFEGENHSLSRSGKPKHRIRRLKEMTDWFDQYLINK